MPPQSSRSGNCGYERGYSPDTASGGNNSTDHLKIASKLSSQLGFFATTNYENFFDQTGGGFVAEFPSHLSLSSGVDLGYIRDVWSILNDILQTPTSAQWNATVVFNHRRQRRAAKGERQTRSDKAAASQARGRA
jgi:hypothetical protein